ASLCALKSAIAMIDTTLVTIWYQAGTKGFFVRSISHATTNCVVPPNIVTDKAYMMASPLDRTDFGNASNRNAYIAAIPVEKTKFSRMFTVVIRTGVAVAEVRTRYAG